MQNYAPLSKTLWVVLAVLVLVGVVSYFFPPTMWTRHTSAQENEVRQLTWVITHKPISVFDRAKDVFVEEFNKDSDTKISVQVLGPDDFQTEANRLGSRELFEMMSKGDVHIGTITMGSIQKDIPQLAVFSLPYLFRSDAHVDTVFTGTIGAELLDAMSQALPVKAYAFTFSGGWLVIQSNTTSFTREKDFSGKSITGINGGITLDVLRATGADVVQLDTAAISNREINESIDTYDGIETVLTRLHKMDSPKYVTETKHALFVTAIVADKTFIASLSERDKAAFARASNAAAAIERADSRQLAMDNARDLASRGTQVVTLTLADRDDLAKKMSAVYAQYEASIGKELIERIKSLQD